MLTCPACRNPVDIPADHAASTIRCGICWAEIALDAKPEEDEEGVEVPVLVAAYDDPFRGYPGRTVPGMAPLEDLLRKVAERMPNLFASAAVPESEPEIFPAEAPRRSERRRGEDDDLRRKRGTASSRMSLEKMKAQAAPRPPLLSKLMMILLIALAVAVFLLAWQRFG